MARRPRKRFERPVTPPIAPMPNEPGAGGETSPRPPIQAEGANAALLPPAPTPITDLTPFRATGDVTFDVYRKLHRDAGSRLDDETLRLMHNAGLGVTALLADRERAESTFGTASLPAPNNILGLQDRNGSLNFEAFPSPVDCVREVVRRWTVPDYKGGVYMPRELSLGAMIAKYSPPSENDTPALVRACVSNINQWRGEALPGQPPSYHFGMPDWPREMEVHILDLAPSGQGWDNLGDRSAVMCGVVAHHTAGGGDRWGVYNLFSRGGGRWGQAATDLVIDRQAKGLVMLDPWSEDPMDGSGVTPWASGPASNLKGIGVQIVQKLGANAVNKRFLSCEHVHQDGQNFPDAMMDLSCRAFAVGITRMAIPYDQFPYNPKVGLQVNAYHRHFAPTTCPSDDFVNQEYEAWTKGIILEAKKLQTGTGTGGPIVLPPVEPNPDPRTYTAFGLPREMIDTLFGTMVRVDEQGNETELGFNPEGVLSQLWLQRFGPLGIFPEAEEMHVFDSQLAPGKEYFATWEGGYTAWLPLDNNRVGWRWLDQTPFVEGLQK